MSVCVPSQEAITLSVTDEGEIHIEQPSAAIGLPDAFIAIHPHNLPLLIAGLQALLPKDPS